jgi:hypothetical protein
MTNSEREPDDERFVEDEEDAAAAEAAGIGGRRPDYHVDDDHDGDEAFRPLEEAGEGESEGFELAEQDLIEEASHGEGGHYPGDDAFEDEQDAGAVYGEPDEEEEPDL